MKFVKMQLDDILEVDRIGTFSRNQRKIIPMDCFSSLYPLQKSVCFLSKSVVISEEMSNIYNLITV